MVHYPEPVEDVFEIYKPSDPYSIKADIVFLHGLGGGYLKTWTNKNDNVWPAHWLGPDLDPYGPFRILSLQYNAFLTNYGRQPQAIRRTSDTLLDKLSLYRSNSEPKVCELGVRLIHIRAYFYLTIILSLLRSQYFGLAIR